MACEQTQIRNIWYTTVAEVILTAPVTISFCVKYNYDSSFILETHP